VGSSPGETLLTALEWIGLRPGADTTQAILARFRPPAPGEAGDRSTPSRWRWIECSEERSASSSRTGNRIYIRRMPRFLEGHFARSGREVRYPGEYPITAGTDRVRDLIERAGTPARGRDLRVTLIPGASSRASTREGAGRRGGVTSVTRSTSHLRARRWNARSGTSSDAWP